jgi:hypothetical protein
VDSETTQKKWLKQAKNGHCIIVILMSTVLKTETPHSGYRSPNDCMESQPRRPQSWYAVL